MPWLRLYVEIIDDEKLRLLAFEDRWHYVALLCCKRAGLLDSGDAPQLLQRKLAVKLGLQLRELEAMALRLAEVGLIDADSFQPLGWDGRQMRSDSSTARVRAFRERMKRAGNVSGTGQDTDTDTDNSARVPACAPAREAPGAPAAPRAATPTTAGIACRLMREAGCPHGQLNPSHPDLIAALADGVSPDALADTVREAVAAGKAKPFAWAIATARGRLDETRNPAAPGVPARGTPQPRESLVDRAAQRAARILAEDEPAAAAV